MKRSASAAFSLTSVLTAVLLLGLLAWYAWRGNLLFSPGALSAQTQTAVTLQGFQNHASFEKQCQLCHQPLTKPINILCLECHTEIQAQIQTNGLHNRLPQAQQCTTCHREHRGRDFNPSDSARQNFDHNLATFSLLHHAVDYTASPMPCQACHNADKPANHYSGQCSLCHSTDGWGGANFNHSGQTDCQSCHTKDKPANHYSGQCSLCHSTDGWGGANFNHSGQTDCQACHSGDKPANHYSGQCSLCHNTNNWGSVDFNHAGFTDCQSCHARPANHYSGQCSLCHNTNNWGNVDFNHTGYTDCRSCHSDDAPANHWTQQCSTCHNTNNWGQISVGGHTFPLNHGDSDGQCSNCHPSNSPGYTCWGCHNRQDTIQEHEEEGITDIEGRCMECHPDGETNDSIQLPEALLNRWQWWRALLNASH